MMLGCELTDMDAWTKSLVTNDEVLGLLSKSRNAHQVLRTGEFILWKVEDEEGNVYAACFNITNWEETFSVSLKQLGLEGKCRIHDMWSGEDLGEAKEAIEVTLRSHDAKSYRLK